MFLSLGKISFWEILPHCPQFRLVICWNPECFGIFKAIMIFFRHQVKVTLYQTLIHPNLIKICVYNVLSKNHIQRRKCRNPNFFPPETSKIRTRKWKKTWFWEKKSWYWYHRPCTSSDPNYSDTQYRDLSKSGIFDRWHHLDDMT